MFGFGLKSKAKRVIKEEFFYEVSYMYGPLFNNFVQQGKMLGQNEYSIAIMYMTVMMNVLVENQKEFPGDLAEVEQFIKKHTSNINRIIHQANSPESDIRKLLEEVNRNFLSISKQGSTSDNEKNLNSNSTQQQNESSGSEELDNPFKIGDEKRAWLSSEIKAFVACIEATKFFIHEKIKEKDLEISKDDINYIRAFQLYGALDFIAQNEGWTPEQIIEPFITICLTEHPDTFGLAINPGKILGFMNNPNVLARFPEIQQIQINGAYLYDDTKSLPIRTSMDKQPFSDAMMVAAEKNTSEILGLISMSLIDSFKTLNE